MLLIEPYNSLVANKVNDFSDVSRLFPDVELSVGTAAVGQYPGHARLDLCARAQIVDNIVNKFKQFLNEINLVSLSFLPKIHEFSMDAIARCTPLILHDQCPAILAKAEILR